MPQTLVRCPSSVSDPEGRTTVTHRAVIPPDSRRHVMPSDSHCVVIPDPERGALRIRRTGPRQASAQFRCFGPARAAAFDACSIIASWKPVLAPPARTATSRKLKLAWVPAFAGMTLRRERSTALTATSSRRFFCDLRRGCRGDADDADAQMGSDPSHEKSKWITAVLVRGLTPTARLFS